MRSRGGFRLQRTQVACYNGLMVRSIGSGALGVLFLAAVAVGCKGSDDDDGAAASCPLPADARGTAECHRWQEAICEFGGKCGSLEQCDCIEQSSGIECTSDTEATRCADVLESATCSDTGSLAGCDLRQMANPAPAQAGCQLYLTRACEAVERCGGDPVATCLQQLTGTGAGQLDCTRAIGLNLSFEKCISELQTIACTVDELPTSCKGAVLLN
jgi:hypothetical protein